MKTIHAQKRKEIYLIIL